MTTSAAWVEHLAGGLQSESLGPLAGVPVLVAHIDGGQADHRLARLTRDLPCVTVGIDAGALDRQRRAGVSGAWPDFDILLTPLSDPPRPWVGTGALSGETVEEAATRIEVTAAASPQASVALVQLLRLGSRTTTADALVAESFVYSMLQAGPEFASWLRQRRAPTVKPQSGPAVLLERYGSVLEVTFNRPQVRNAYSTELRDGLVAALDLTRADPAITELHLRGAGPAFCSGGDLAEFGSTPDPVTAHTIRTTRSAALLLTNSPARTVAHTHGACVGAGAELASFANEVVADPEAFFQLPEVTMGLVPGAGGTSGLPRRIGRQRTAFMAMTACRLDVATALSWGLVDEVRDLS